MAANTGSDIVKAASLLKAGGLVALPTETVYGLGANAFDGTAVARVFEAKQRPGFDPLIVHIAERNQVDEVASGVSEIAERLMDAFWPGPLTLVLPRQEAVSDLVTSGLNTVGVRMPDHAMTREVIRTAGVPIAAPSANLFGRISPTTAAHVEEQLADRVDYILDGGPCSVGVESTVVRVQTDEAIVLRPGGLTLEALREVTDRVRLLKADGTETTPASPGRTLQHYAPRTRLVVRREPGISDDERDLKVGLLSAKPAQESDFDVIENLGSDLRTAAANFFAALRRLDAAKLDLIVATPFPDEGLGLALNDRLSRAAVEK
ncbi:MAG: L-threonylcarbamoyladenylate synthase [Planctomycetaceae bacterium]